MEKRYQYWGPNGITWTRWFKCKNNTEPIQLKGRGTTTLKNEYR